MNTGDRMVRMAEVECASQKLVDKGWKVERIAYEDERDKPFTAHISLSVDGASELKGVL